MSKIIIGLLFISFSNYLMPTIKYPIFIKEYNVYLYPEKGCKMTYNLKVNDSITLKINLLSCRGAMSIEAYMKQTLIEKGMYVNSLGLLKTYSTRIGFNRKLNKSVKEIIISEYYQPLRDSLWSFYKNDSVTYISYKKGVQQQ